MSIHYYFGFCLLSSVLYLVVCIESKGEKNYEQFFNFTNHTNHLNELFSKNSKVNFNEYILTDPVFNDVINIDQMLKDSEILYICDKNIPNLNDTKELDRAKKYPDILLCMGLFHILTLNSFSMRNMHKTDPMRLPLPKNKSELDILVDNFNSNDTLKHSVMCEEHKVTLPSYQTEVTDYIKLLNPYLNNIAICKSMCLRFDISINPICALIMESNSVFYEMLNQNYQNTISENKNIDSANALEQGSELVKTVPNTKEIIDEPKEEIVRVNKGNVALVSANNIATKKNNRTIFVANKNVGKDSNVAKSVDSVFVEGTVTDTNQTNALSNSEKPSETPLPDTIDDTSNEITGDGNESIMDIEKEIPTKSKPLITVQSTNNHNDNAINSEGETLNKIEITEKASPSTNSNTLPPNITAKVTDVEDNAKEAENEADNSLLQNLGVESSIKLDVPNKVQKVETNEGKIKSTKEDIKDVTKMTRKLDNQKVIVEDGSFLDGDDEDTNVMDQPKFESPPEAQVVPNFDTLEGDNPIVNPPVVNNNNDEDIFSSNVDKQGVDPGVSSKTEVQENTPYIIVDDRFVEAEDSHFFTYFVLMFVVCIVLYLVFCNKRKLLALALEGRHAGSRRSRSRKHTAYSRVNNGFDESKEHLLY